MYPLTEVSLCCSLCQEPVDRCLHSLSADAGGRWCVLFTDYYVVELDDCVAQGFSCTLCRLITRATITVDLHHRYRLCLSNCD